MSGEVGNLLAQAGGGADVLIYVHGFNQTLRDSGARCCASFRCNQDSAPRRPSKAELFDYTYDRESAMFSRDDFERVLSSIVSAPAASRVHIVAAQHGNDADTRTPTVRALW